MAIRISGFPQSSYVWTARAALTVKQIDHEFEPMVPGAHKMDDHLSRHPFGKVPVVQIDGENLFETSAIMRWANAAGNGPDLFPGNALESARVEQWISAISAYYYGPVVPDYILKYVFAGEAGPDRASVDAALPALQTRLAILNDRAGSPWLVGNTMTAADLLAGPLLMGLTMFPEGKQIMADNPKLGHLVGALAETPAFMAGSPPPPG